MLIQSRVENLNGDLHQPSGIGMFRDPLVLDVLFLLHIGKELISVVTLSVVVHPKP